MSDIQRHRICLEDITQGGSTCSNPTITWDAPQCITVPCVEDNCIEVEVLPDCGDACITVTIDCDDCEKCPPLVKTICFCSTSDDCSGDCEYCNGGICESFCPDGKLCQDDTCVDCTTDADCECDQECVQGTCQCPQDRPIQRPDGCCVECIDNSNCGPCEVCVSGECVQKTCPEGNCDPFTGNCVECWNNDQCTNPNECCQDDGTCDCCDGYYRDPVSQECVEIPNCFTHGDCPDCFDCVDGDCVPKVCPDGKVCVDGECIPGCTGPFDCPPGQGCLDGVCVDCDTLDCAGNPSPCERAKGCDCDDDNSCGAVDCSNVGCVEWVVTPAEFIPGDSTADPGLPALLFTADFEDLGIVDISGDGAFRDYRITVATSGGQSGSWSVEGGYNTTGTSISFTLSQTGPVQWNNVGFEVSFTESGGTGRTGSIVVYNTNWDTIDPTDIEALSTIMTDPANWEIDVQANSIAPGSSTGTFVPGSLQLCACNPNTSIQSYTWTTTEGNLTLTLYPKAGEQCAKAVVQGCGVGEGTVTVDCAGTKRTIAIPELPYDYSGENCCDPLTDPNCTGEGGGDPCVDFTTVTGEIAFAPFNNDIWIGVLQALPGKGLSRPKLVRASRNFCWSTTGNMTIFGGYPSFPGQFQHVIYSGGAGCLQLGYDCTISLGNCEKLQAEVCREGCEAFTAYISGVLEPGETLTALTSFGGRGLTLTWSTNDPSFTVPVGPTLTIPDPNLGITSITLSASVSINNATCSDSVVVTVTTTDLPTVGTPTYTCADGLQFNDSGGVTYTNEGGGTLQAGQRLVEDLAYEVIADLGPTTQSFFIDIPACYACPDCAQDISGIYSTLDECNRECDTCDSSIWDAEIGFSCQDQAVKVIFTINAGTGPYSYSISSTGSGSPVTGTFTGTSHVVTGIAPGDITANIADTSTGCDADQSITKNCTTCVPNDGTVSFTYDDSEWCDGGLLSLNISSQSASPYPIQVEIIPQGDTEATLTGATNGPNLTINGSLANGNYTILVTDAYGCSASQLWTVDCQPGACQNYDPVFTQFAVQDLGGDNQVNVAWETSTDNALPSGAQLQVEKLITGAGCPGTGTYSPVGSAINIGFQTSGFESITDPNGSGEAACYRVTISYMAGTTPCSTTTSTYYTPLLAPPTNPCAICTDMPGMPCNDVTWADDELTISWCFQYPPTAFTITVDDPAGLTTFANGSTSKVITSSTNTSTGTLTLASPATTSNRTINVDFETGQESCDYNCDVLVTGCTCSISNLVVTPVPENGFLQLDFDTACTSGTVLVTATGDIVDSVVLEQTDGVGVGVGTSSVSYVWDVSDLYPVGGGSVTITIEDNLDAGCTTSVVETLPSSCDCSLSAANYVYDIDTLDFSFDVTAASCNSTSISVVMSDSAGAFVLTPASPFTVTPGGTTTITTTLDRAAQSNIDILIQDTTDGSCTFSDNVDVCTITAAGTLGTDSFFAAWDVFFNSNPADSDTVVINGRTYTFQTTLTDVDGNIQIGVDAEATAANFRGAINIDATGGGAGVAYAASMTLNADVEAFVGTADSTVRLIAKTAGTAGEVAISDTSAGIAIQLALAGTDTGFYAIADTVTALPTSYGDQGAVIFDHVGTISLNVLANDDYTFSYPTAGGQATISCATGSCTSPLSQIKNAAIANGAYENQAAFLGGDIPLSEVGTWVRNEFRDCAISQSGGTATVTLANHGFSSGDNIIVQGSNVEEYNGTFVNITVLNSSTFTYGITATAPATATGSPQVATLSEDFTASACITVGLTADYFIAFSIDNVGTVSIDNTPIIDLQVSSSADSVTQQLPFRLTYICKVNLTAGTHLLSVSATNVSGENGLQYMVIDENLAGITGAGSLAALTLVSDSSVVTGDLDNTISENISGGVECTSGSLYYDGCTPNCTDCF